MEKRWFLVIGVLLAVVAAGALAWYLVLPLFIDRTVDEATPVGAGLEEPGAGEAGDSIPAATEADLVLLPAVLLLGRQGDRPHH